MSETSTPIRMISAALGRDLSRTSRIRLLVPFLVAVLTLAACTYLGSDRSVVTVEMTEGAWSVMPEELSEAELVFRVTNTGADGHRPVVIKTATPPAELRIVRGEVDLSGTFIVWPGGGGSFSEWPPEEMADLFPLVEAGKTVEDAARKAGEGHPGLGTYVVLCMVPGHYERGEYASFEMRAADG